MEVSYQKELAGFETDVELANITSNNQFIVKYDVNKNLSVYQFSTSKQQKVTAQLPKSELIDIKLPSLGSLFIASFNDGSIYLFNANEPNSIISKYNYYNSIDKEKTKTKEQCYFRNLTFVDNMSFIAVLQKGTTEQLFKFAIAQGKDNEYSIMNYCDYINFKADRESQLIGNPLKIFDSNMHISRISSVLFFSEGDLESAQKSQTLPQIIGISLKKPNKFIIATVNNFRFEIIQSFTADDSISSFSYLPEQNIINVAFTSYSYHMIFVKSLTIPNERTQRIFINEVCTIKLEVIICSNLKSMSFISPELFSIIYTSPGTLNTSVYSIKTGAVIGILPPVFNKNLLLGSNTAVATTFTNDTIFLISKGSALAFSNKDVSHLVEEGKFRPPKSAEPEKNTVKSFSLIYHSNNIDNEGGPKTQPLGRSRNSSRLISFWNDLSSGRQEKPIVHNSVKKLNKSALASFQSLASAAVNEEQIGKDDKLQNDDEMNKMKETHIEEEVDEISTEFNNDKAEDSNVQIEHQENVEQENTQAQQEQKNVEPENTQIQQEQENVEQENTQTQQEQENVEQENTQVQQEQENVEQENTQTQQEQENSEQENTQVQQEQENAEPENTQVQQEQENAEPENAQVEQQEEIAEPSNAQVEQPKESVESSNAPAELNITEINNQNQSDATNLPKTSPREGNEFQKFKDAKTYEEGIKYCINLINDQSNQSNPKRLEDIQSNAISFLNSLINNEINDKNINISVFSEKIIKYSIDLDLVYKWLLTKPTLCAFQNTGDKYKEFLYSIIVHVPSSKFNLANPVFIKILSRNCPFGFNEETIKTFLMNLVPSMTSIPMKINFFKDYLAYAKNINSYSFAGDVYYELIHDYANALKCYEISSKKDNGQCIDRMAKILTENCTCPAVINWLFGCIKDASSNNVSFPRLTAFFIKSKGAIIDDETQVIQILKRIIETVFFTNPKYLTIIVNAILITLSKEQISSQNSIYKFMEEFLIASLSQSHVITAFSKKSIEYLSEQIFTKDVQQPDNRETLLLSILNAENDSGNSLHLFSVSPDISNQLAERCRSFGFQEALERLNEGSTKLDLEPLLNDAITFVHTSLFGSSTFDSELSSKRKGIFEYIETQYSIESNRRQIESFISKNICNLISLFSLSSNSPISADQSYLQKLFGEILPESFVKELPEKFMDNDDITLTFIHLLISSGIEKSPALLEVIAPMIIKIIPFFVAFPDWKDDIKLFIIMGSRFIGISDTITKCLTSPKFLEVCENHLLFDCCCLLNIINKKTDKTITYLQQLIFSLNSNDFQKETIPNTKLYIRNETDSNENELSFESEVSRNSELYFNSDYLIDLIGDIKCNIDIVKVTASMLFQDSKQNAWKAFMLLVDVFVVMIKDQTNHIGTYFLDGIVKLYHDICFIMSSNESNEVDFCEIIRVTRDSFSSLCESFQKMVVKAIISDQIFSPISVKSLEKGALQKHSQNKVLLKQVRCARCKMPLFIDDIGIYSFECGHAVHNLLCCNRNGKQCPLCFHK